MPRKIGVRIGQRFGKLVTVAPVTNDNTGRTMWACRCDCGNGIDVRTQALQRGHSRSCGCLAASLLQRGVLTVTVSASVRERAFNAPRPMEHERSRMPHATQLAQAASLDAELFARMNAGGR